MSAYAGYQRGYIFIRACRQLDLEYSTLGEMVLRGTSMPKYRVYSVDEEQKIVACAWVQAKAVDEAIVRVRQIKGRHAFELWDAFTCLAKVPAGKARKH